MNAEQYLAHDGIGLARLIERREVSRREVAHAAIAMIEKLNPSINAVVHKNYEVADRLTESLRASNLNGVPFLLKDVNLYSSDMPTTFGSTFFRGSSNRPDSLMVERWRSAGLTILGKTNTPEFAAEFVTEPAAYGPTRNPLFPGMTVGGSSGGAAAAVASGMVPIAHATDLGGSIRIPAACCGVYGFKPTAELNSVGPYFSEIAGGLNSDHVVSRTVRDSAASLDITANCKNGRSAYLANLALPTGKLRIGFSVRDPLGRLAGADQQAAVRKATVALQALGHELFEYTYPDGLNTGWFDFLWISDIVTLVEERASALRRHPHPDELEPLTWHLMEKARAGGDAAINIARMERVKYTDRYLNSMAGMDILLTPSLAENPPPDGTLGFDSFADVDRWNEAGYRFAPFSIPANISGQPSASCPWFTGLLRQSVGIQLNAKPGRDLLVLQLSAQLEQFCLVDSSSLPALGRHVRQ